MRVPAQRLQHTYYYNPTLGIAQNSIVCMKELKQNFVFVDWHVCAEKNYFPNRRPPSYIWFSILPRQSGPGSGEVELIVTHAEIMAQGHYSLLQEPTPHAIFLHFFLIFCYLPLTSVTVYEMSDWLKMCGIYTHRSATFMVQLQPVWYRANIYLVSYAICFSASISSTIAPWRPVKLTVPFTVIGSEPKPATRIWFRHPFLVKPTFDLSRMHNVTQRFC